MTSACVPLLGFYGLCSFIPSSPRVCVSLTCLTWLYDIRYSLSNTFWPSLCWFSTSQLHGLSLCESCTGSRSVGRIMKTILIRAERSFLSHIGHRQNLAFLLPALLRSHLSRGHCQEPASPAFPSSHTSPNYSRDQDYYSCTSPLTCARCHLGAESPLHFETPAFWHTCIWGHLHYMTPAFWASWILNPLGNLRHLLPFEARRLWVPRRSEPLAFLSCPPVCATLPTF